jgi:hypothetical protein
MSNRDWEKELAMIDRQLASISDEELAKQDATAPTAPARPAAGTRAAPAAERPRPTAAGAAAGPTVVQVRSPSPGSRVALYARLLGAVALGVGILFWPYGARCGLPLAGFLGATAVIALSGIWAAAATWRHRAGRSHVLALLVVAWGLGLDGWQVLPRVGLAIPTMDRPAIWACQ